MGVWGVRRTSLRRPPVTATLPHPGLDQPAWTDAYVRSGHGGATTAIWRMCNCFVFPHVEPLAVIYPLTCIMIVSVPVRSRKVVSPPRAKDYRPYRLAERSRHVPTPP